MQFSTYTKVAKIEGNLQGAQVTWDWSWSGTEHGIPAPNVLPSGEFCLVTNQAIENKPYVLPNAGVLTLTPSLVCGEGESLMLDPITLNVGLSFVGPESPCCVGMIDPSECPPCECAYTQLYSFGSNAYGSLGTGYLGDGSGDKWAPVTVPVNVTDMIPEVVTFVGSTRWHYFIVITDSGKVYQVGEIPPDWDDTPIWLAVAGLESGVTQVSGGMAHALAIKNDEVWAWGDDYDGVTSVGTTSVALPVGLNQVLKVSCGSVHSLALKVDGTLWAWGRNSRGELGLGDTTKRQSPVLVAITSVSDVVGGEDFTIVAKSDGSVWSCGANEFGQLGVGDKTDRITLTQVPISGVKSVASGRFHAIALKTDGTVWAWGHNWYSQLGTLAGEPLWESTTPIQVNLPQKAVDVFCGDAFTFAILENGDVYGWGMNDAGQIGIGTVGPTQGHVHTPTKIINGERGVMLAGGQACSMMLRCYDCANATYPFSQKTITFNYVYLEQLSTYPYLIKTHNSLQAPPPNSKIKKIILDVSGDFTRYNGVEIDPVVISGGEAWDWNYEAAYPATSFSGTYTSGQIIWEFEDGIDAESLEQLAILTDRFEQYQITGSITYTPTIIVDECDS